MTKFKKALSGLLTLSTALTFTGLGMVSTTYGAQLTSASSTLSNPRPNQTSSYTIQFNVATSGNLREVQLQFAIDASATGTVPNSFNASSATLSDLSILTDTEADWAINAATSGQVTLRRASTATAVTQGDTFLVTLGGVANPDLTSNCDAVSNSESCFLRIRTYSDTGSTLVDTTTITYTVTSASTVTATVDPILTFTVAGVNSATISSNDSNVGSGTAVTTTATTVPFGNVTVGTAKMGQHQLNTLTNSNGGYFVYGKFVTGSGQVMIGNANSSNNIDKFTGNSATWANPAAFIAPTGTAANVNAAWLGVRTNDPQVANFGTSNFYAPPDVDSDSGVGKAVMSSTTPDDGTTPAYVTFKIQANAFQPADSYSGTWVYNVVPTY